MAKKLENSMTIRVLYTLPPSRSARIESRTRRVPANDVYPTEAVVPHGKRDVDVNEPVQTGLTDDAKLDI
ncbi:MAG: hypothetical protein ABI670_21020 [Chloroflexota bacterium]